jgi:hypothetical protein
MIVLACDWIGITDLLTLVTKKLLSQMQEMKRDIASEDKWIAGDYSFLPEYNSKLLQPP